MNSAAALAAQLATNLVEQARGRERRGKPAKKHRPTNREPRKVRSTKASIQDSCSLDTGAVECLPGKAVQGLTDPADLCAHHALGCMYRLLYSTLYRHLHEVRCSSLLSSTVQSILLLAVAERERERERGREKGGCHARLRPKAADPDDLRHGFGNVISTQRIHTFRTLSLLFRTARCPAEVVSPFHAHDASRHALQSRLYAGLHCRLIATFWVQLEYDVAFELSGLAFSSSGFNVKHLVEPPSACHRDDARSPTLHSMTPLGYQMQ